MTHPNPEGGEAWTLHEYRSPRGTYFVTDASGAKVASSLKCGERQARLITAAPDLLALARVSAAQFRFYEQQHRAKGTPEADAKAEVNRELAERIEAAISAATGARP